jgi:hypothetical protein
LVVTKPAGVVNLRLALKFSREEIPKSAQGLMAGAVSGDRSHDDVVEQFNFQKLAGAD